MPDRLGELVQATLAGPVFGPGVAFGAIEPDHLERVLERGRAIQAGLSERVDRTLAQAFPQRTADERQYTIREVSPKATGFVPLLTNLELPPDFLGYETSTAESVFYMYVDDQEIDRGNEAMVLATEDAYGPDKPSIPSELAEQARHGGRLLTAMAETIRGFARPEDYGSVLGCFKLVLRGEARQHRLSTQYDVLTSETAKADFLACYAGSLAMITVEDAGFQSVTAALYALYRRLQPDLPSVRELHDHSAITRLIRLCNTAARVADERGDWKMDAGYDPSKGVFTLNPFNQYHPDYVQNFCRLADIRDPAIIDKLQEAFRLFHEDRIGHGAFITDTFFGHVRNEVLRAQERLPQYRAYLRLFPRVLEISHVNMLGDILLAG